MTTTNRFAPPKAEVEDRTGLDTEMWREGKLLVIRKDGEFPHRCIKCNAPSVGPKRRYKLSWHSPWLYLLLLAAVLLYAIVAAIVRKTATVDIRLCERHQKRVLWGRLIGWGGLAIELGLVGLSIGLDNSGFGLAAGAIVLPWLLATSLVNRIVLPQRIDDRTLRLKGCGPEFLRSLPDRSWQ